MQGVRYASNDLCYTFSSSKILLGELSREHNNSSMISENLSGSSDHVIRHTHLYTKLTFLLVVLFYLTTQHCLIICICLSSAVIIIKVFIL